MRIGAKITLNTGIGAARDGLASLAGAGWLMSLPLRQDLYHGHPAGRARSAPAISGGGPELVAVTFGTFPVPAGPGMTLSVRWEPLERSDECAVLLDGDIALAPLPGPAGSILTLAGTGRIPSAVLTEDEEDGAGRATHQVIESVLEFITSTALVLAGPADPDREPPGSALSWLVEEPREP
jgi:hypothetical protein